MKKSRRLYLNPKQREILAAQQKDRTAIWGRGCGKSHNMGVSQRVKAGLMPRSKGAIISTTYNQLYTKTWAGIEASWNLMGMKEGRDYVFGIKPPRHFDDPIAKVKRYANVVSLKNGRMIEFLSMDRPDLARGGSYDDMEVDECLLVKEDHINIVLLPALRGNLHRFSHTHWHHSIIKYSSMPWTSSGLYLLDFKEKALRQPDLFFYSEATAYDNIHILGEEGIERMRRTMSPIQFAMEVMNEQILRTEEPFYESFDLQTHTYEPQYSYARNDMGRDVPQGTNDVDPTAILETTWDFGGWFSCCAVFQEKEGRTERMVNAFNAQGNERVTDIVTKFCDTYATHQHKVVRLWGEPRGHDKQASMTDSIYDFLRKKFHARGWHVVTAAPRGTSREQKERRPYMSTIMAEDTRGYPLLRINRDACKWCTIAIQQAKSKPDGSKDKSNEKDRSFPQEHATHITDAIDYYFDQKWGPRVALVHGSTRGLAGSADFY